MTSSSPNPPMTEPATDTEVCPLPEGEQLLQECFAELESTTRDEAKALIRLRVQEIARLRALLAKAEADLQQLISRPASEIAMLRSGGVDLVEPLSDRELRRFLAPPRKFS